MSEFCRLHVKKELLTDYRGQLKKEAIVFREKLKLGKDTAGDETGREK